MICDHPDIVVIGSCMTDLIAYCPRLPANGETIKGSKFNLGFGGKGANQCVAAKKLGASTRLIAKLGNDSFGLNYWNYLKEVGVDNSCVKLVDGLSSGMAQICVANDGGNHIVIVPGANDTLCEEDVDEKMISSAKVVIFQFETPLSTTIHALKICKQLNTCITIVNAAPGVEYLDPALLRLPDILCMNETEAETCSGIKVNSTESAFDAAKKFISEGCKTVIITMGSKPTVLARRDCPDTPMSIPTDIVDAPVDTTGAGDAFVGALAFYLSRYERLSLEEIIRRCNTIAAFSIMRSGTQISYPYKADLPPSLFD